MTFVDGAGDEVPLVPQTRLFRTFVDDVSFLVRRLPGVMTSLTLTEVEDLARGGHHLAYVVVNTERLRKKRPTECVTRMILLMNGIFDVAQAPVQNDAKSLRAAGN